MQSKTGSGLESEAEIFRRKPPKQEAEKKALSSEHTRQSNAGGGLLLPTGLALLNLGMSNTIDGGYESGRIVNIIGDSHAGKTILALSGLAEMAANPVWNEYMLLFQDVERAMSFNVRKLFGTALERRLRKAWREESEEDIYTPPKTIQDFYQRILRRIDSGRPFVEVVDSLDALTTTEEIKRSEDMKNSGKEAGSYKMEKARWASEILRVISNGLSETKSLLIIISQTRDNIEPIGFQKKTRSGGKALEFYASHIFWLAKLNSITQGSNARKIKVGRNVVAKITKTKRTGFEGEVRFPIYRQIGVDDTSATLDFLVEWSPRWKKSGNSIACDELNIKGFRKDLCHKIEREFKEEIREHLQEAWNEYLAAADIGRQSRFSDI